MSQTLADLQRPLPPLSPKALYYGVARAALAFGSLFSKGLSIGRTYGFDSGIMLDYVYDNRARGFSPLGRLIDRTYLNAPGWVGIRRRGDLVRKIIADEILKRAEGPVRLADLACGGGRYVVGALRDARSVAVDAVLRDYRPENVERTWVHAEQAGLKVRAETGDAFDARDLARLGERDIVIVSGLHEIIDDDTLVRAHFQQIHEVLAPGGSLVVTIQPDHPQLEFIARVLTSHTGRPWAMRLRDVALTRQWLTEAGFAIQAETMEETGIFGVIVATKAA